MEVRRAGQFLRSSSNHRLSRRFAERFFIWGFHDQGQCCIGCNNGQRKDSHQESECQRVSLLINAFDTSTLQGEFVFYKFENFTDDKVLTAHFEKNDVIQTVDYEQDWFSMEIEHDNMMNILHHFVLKLNWSASLWVGLWTKSIWFSTF